MKTFSAQNPPGHITPLWVKDTFLNMTYTALCSLTPITSDLICLYSSYSSLHSSCSHFPFLLQQGRHISSPSGGYALVLSGPRSSLCQTDPGAHSHASFKPFLKCHFPWIFFSISFKITISPIPYHAYESDSFSWNYFILHIIYQCRFIVCWLSPV